MNTAQATPASLWLRLLAGAYDLLPLLGLWFTAVVIALLVTAGKLDTHNLADKLLVQALVVAAAAIYFIVSWLRGGQTIGMKPWRLRIVRANGSPLGTAQALLRFAVACVSLTAFGAGFWWMLIDADRRAWHDIAAGTLVVRMNKKSS